MVFIELNNGKKLNVLHISKISVEENDVIYESAKGSLNNIKEHFDSSQEAETRYQELQKELYIRKITDEEMVTLEYLYLV